MNKAVALRSETPPARLEMLAATARAQHGLVQEALKRTLEHVIACGQALSEARQMVPSGQWQCWLTENVGVHRTTAQWYIRVAEFRNELEVVGVTSLSAAQTYLRRNGLVLEVARRPASDGVVLEIHALAEQGIPHLEIARRVGVDRKTVRRRLRAVRPPKLNPRPVSETPQPSVEITDDMIEGMARWLVVRGQMGLTDQTRRQATEALRVALNYRSQS